MGVTEATKNKILNCLGSSAKSAFFQIADSGSLWGPLDDLGSKNARAITPIEIWFWGGSLLYPECLTLKLKNPIFKRNIFFPQSGLIFS
jgi:hypothetical protein